MIQEKYLPTEWLNSNFVEIVNCDIEVRPSQEWFLHPVFALRKRDGIFSKQWTWGINLWQWDGTFQWAIQQSGNIFAYTNNWSLYNFNGSDLTSLKTGLFYSGVDFDNVPVVVNYAGGWRYPNASTTFTVSAYNALTATITTVENTIDSSFTNKFCYIATGTWERQLRQILLATAPNQIQLVSAYWVNPVLNDTIEIYNERESQIFYPQLRKWSVGTDVDYLYSRDASGNDLYWYFPNSRKIVIWDNRLMQLHKNRVNILPSDSQDYEQILLTKIVSLGNDAALNIDVYSGYLIIFFEDKIGLLRKVITDQTTQDFVYYYQDLLDTGLFSEDAYIIQGNNLYIFGNDRRLYSVDIEVWGTWEVVATAVDQWQLLVNYFSKITDGTVSFEYDGGNLYMVHKTSTPTPVTTVYKYNDNYKCWLIDRYNFVTNFFEKLYNIDGVKFSYTTNTMVQFGWLKDLGTNISQSIKLYWPIQALMSLLTLLQIKIRLWFDGQAIGGKLKIRIAWYRYFYKEVDLATLDIIDLINQYALGNNTMGSLMMWDFQFGWEYGFGEITDYFSEYIDIGYRIGKKWSHFEFEILNDTDKQLYFCWCETQYNPDNPFVIYNKGVI